MDDRTLASRIHSALLRDHRLSSQPVEVSIEHGIATLRGTVQSHRRKLAAAEIAASFHECHGVINELTVEPPHSLTDEQIADLVRSALSAQAEIHKSSIAVSVKAGAVILSGGVGSAWERRIAEDVALAVQGVRDVRNLLLVDAIAQGAGEALSREIEDAMSDVRGLQGVPIHAAVAGDSVVLSGKVSALWQREAAEAVVTRFGLFRIRNDIQVQPDRGSPAAGPAGGPQNNR